MMKNIIQSYKTIALSSLLFISACNSPLEQTQQQTQQQPASLSELTLVAQEQPFLQDSLLVSWSFAEGNTPVDIFIADAPDASAKKLIARGITGNSYLLARDTDQRQYVFVQPQQGEGHWVGERVLPLQGGFNFRDLGGYATTDGKHVKWGKIYRSGTMVDLTTDDYAYLGKLNLSVMCDFRSREELQHEPTAWQSFAPQAKYLVVDYSMRDLISAEGALRFDQVKTTADAQAMFKEFYRQGPYRFKGQLSEMFDDLAAGKAPLAFNCSAGKDRTGMAAALILTALDVPRNVVVEDYALTEKVADFGAREQMRNARNKPNISDDKQAPHAGIAAMPVEARQVFMGSDPMFIEAMFAELEKNHGSAMNFIREELAVSETELQRLRELYVTN
ncbi:tyrosine-protein phosphatase [Cellvibrio sp. PSBB006]|uniref:tyrosine-protein phosphatase n=1 Tax=Cellvibrio sp. PSBB006 TaxID=1987723 RepID=UPI000B3B620F|nr:tyrosine-protein phosphatase [Cellvibrio sp. PSBB006]ARU29090.1 hypothetical protein CBR65_17505 [Cellvibrio sp. PSBB006]